MAGALVAAVLAYSALHHCCCVRLRDALARRLRPLPPKLAHLLLCWLLRVAAPLALGVELGLTPSEMGYRLPLDWAEAAALTLALAATNVSVSFALVWVAVEVLREEGAVKKVSGWPSRVGPRDILEDALWSFPEEAFYRGFVFMGLRPLGLAPAAVLSSLLFALAHAYAGRAWALMAFLNGVLYSYAIHRTGTVLAPLALHCALNASAPLCLRLLRARVAASLRSEGLPYPRG